MSRHSPFDQNRQHRRLKPVIVATLGKTVYADMLRMERQVAASALDWTIVRLGALFHSPEITDYRAARGIVAVATFAARPTVAGILWNEALQSVSR